MDKDWRADPPYLYSVIDPGAELQVLLGLDDPESFANPCDFTVRTQEGSFSGTAATTDQLEVILRRWKITGEGGGGRYIGLAHLLVLAEPTVGCLREAVVHLIRSDCMAVVLEAVTPSDQA